MTALAGDDLDVVALEELTVPSGPRWRAEY